MLKKKLIVSIIFISLCCLLFAETNVAFEIRPTVSLYFGQQGEYVYQDYFENNKSKSAKLSELDWKTNALCKLGIDFCGLVNEKFGWSLGASGALASNNGSMIDSDWKNVYKLPEFDSERTYLLTNYTTSLESTDCFLKIHSKFFYNFYPAPKVILSPFVELDYRYILMNAWGLNGSYCITSVDSDGYYYGYNSPNSYSVYYPNDVNVIKLEQHWGLLWAGLDVTFLSNNIFYCGLALGIMPFAYCDSRDTHILKNKIFRDIDFGFCFGGRAGIFVGWNVSKKDAIHIDLDFQGMLQLRGETFTSSSKNINFIKAVSSSCGEDFNSVEIKISYVRKI